MNKHRVIIYKSHEEGWSIFCNEKLYKLGFLAVDWAKELEEMCNAHYTAMGFGMGMQGWEL